MKITVNINLEWWIARDEDGDLGLYECKPDIETLIFPK